MVHRCFSHVARPNARVLILGTLPGPESLRRGQYYALARNAFWPIMGRLLNFDSTNLPYNARLAKLTENQIALWDVCSKAFRPGSLDSAIRDVVPNDFHSFFKSHAEVSLVCFNGRKAEALYKALALRKTHALPASVRYALLPSTSPAYAALSFEKKFEAWKKVLHASLHKGCSSSAG